MNALLCRVLPMRLSPFRRFRRFALLALLWAGLAHQALATPYFYRVLIAPPGAIFPVGFEPWGQNQNLLQHVQGTSCNRARPSADTGQRSSYTSMAATLDAALRVARAKLRLQQREGAAAPRVWIYQIRPTGDMHNVALTFERAGQPLHTGPLRAPYQNALLLDEWVSPVAVPPALIREARQFRLVDDQPSEVPGSAVVNALYLDAPPQPSPAPLPPSVITGAVEAPTAIARTRAVIGDAAGVFSACWCDTPQRGPQTRDAVGDAADLCAAQVRFHNTVVPSVRYFPRPDWQAEF